MSTHVRHGVGTVRSYVHGPADLPEFLGAVFGAEELERHVFGPDQYHVEMRIGDSVLVIEAGELPDDIKPWTNSIYVYVPDVDATYELALENGAVSIATPEEKPYGERQAGFRDATGNTWWIATFTG